MDETKAREAVIKAARAVASAPAGSHAHDEARAGLVFALAALDRAHRPPAVPTEPGAYYLEDGNVGLLDKVCNTTRLLDGGVWDIIAEPFAPVWATDPTAGEVARVPSLEEWRDARSNLSHAETQVDIWYARAREIVAERDEALARVRYLEAPGECHSLHRLRERVAELEAERDDDARLAGIGRAILAHMASPGAEDEVIRHASIAEALDYIDDLETARHAQRAREAKLESERDEARATAERVRDILAQRGALWPPEALQLIDDIVGDDKPAFRRREVTRG